MKLNSLKRFIKRRIRSFSRKLRNAREAAAYRFHKNVFVFGAPYHSNAGDQAQSYCIEKWAADNYPGYSIRIFDTLTVSANNYEKLKRIRRNAKKADKLFLHSGYHTTDLYMLEENLQREVIALFADHQIVILPQTILYLSEEEAAKSRKIYNSHSDTLLFCRDNVSYETAETLFSNCKRYLFPDIVTTMIGKYRYAYQRKGILLCTRNDKEAMVSGDEKANLITELLKIDFVDQTDTTLPIDAAFFSENRKEVLEKEWDKYAHYKVVVTDRYHGTIFSLIANTPVVVMPSTDHKLESGVRWFPDEYKDYVTYCSDFELIPNEVRSMYEKTLDHRIPEHFESAYYNKLKRIIEEDAE